MENSTISPIEIDREFNVPVQQLYQAWTSEEALKKWWKPVQEELEMVKAEMQNGGAIEYHFKGDKFQIAGKYSTVEPEKHLVYSWDWSFADENVNKESYTLDITFNQRGEGSALHVIQQGFKTEEEKSTHEKGWERGLQSLEDYLSKK